MSEFERNEAASTSGEYAYKSVMDGNKKTRLWSVISLALAALSLVLCFLGWVGMALCTIALAFAIVSRKMLGYFDKINLASLIVSIFAMVFSVVFTVINSIS